MFIGTGTGGEMGSVVFSPGGRALVSAARPPVGRAPRVLLTDSGSSTYPGVAKRLGETSGGTGVIPDETGVVGAIFIDDMGK